MAFDADRLRKHIIETSSALSKDLDEGADEIDRLLNIAQQAHDRLLRGDSDMEILKLLQAAWDRN